MPIARQMLRLMCGLLLLGMQVNAFAQQFPSVEEGIPWIVTFGKQGVTSWGDDDFSQSFFFVVPPGVKKPIYIRMFDPETGGLNDELKGAANTSMHVAIYGGAGAVSHPDVQKGDPVGKYDAGVLLKEKTFTQDPAYDNKWYTFGPINPSEGELQTEFGGYVIKLIVDGVSGDDGNLYRFFLSESADANKSVQGANGFTFEYCVRMPAQKSTCHMYPFISQDVVRVKQSNFDWDSDGEIKLYSASKNGLPVTTSTEDKWASSLHEISDAEKGGYLDVQLQSIGKANNNNFILRFANQRDVALPFFSVPIGGGPGYRPAIKAVRVPGK